MGQSLGARWRDAFWQVVRQHEYATPLREASLQGRLGQWTQVLTGVAVRTCEALEWRAAAKGHKLDRLPVPHHEYLGMDVMAFRVGGARWCFPTAVVELENSRSEDRIAYSLWKVLCVRADLRIVFCYRRQAADTSALVQHLKSEIVDVLSVEDRLSMRGDVLVVVGSRGDSDVFPYGFFTWWELEKNTGSFHVM